MIEPNQDDRDLINRVVATYRRRAADCRLDVNDVQQEAWLGLLKAARRYDPAKGPWEPWAWRWACHQVQAKFEAHAREGRDGPTGGGRPEPDWPSRDDGPDRGDEILAADAEAIRRTFRIVEQAVILHYGASRRDGGSYLATARRFGVSRDMVAKTWREYLRRCAEI